MECCVITALELSCAALIHIGATLLRYLNIMINSEVTKHLPPLDSRRNTYLIQQIVLHLELTGSGVQVTAELSPVAAGSAIRHHRDLTCYRETSCGTITSHYNRSDMNMLTVLDECVRQRRLINTKLASIIKSINNQEHQ